MIIEKEESIVKKQGDLESKKVTVDVENMEFLATLLSTNLYSNQIGSFLRETVSNGWDSHVEKGNTDEPVIVELGCLEGLDKYYCFIQDFGTGMSVEKFDSIYRKLGSSDKRASANSIGGFGNAYRNISVNAPLVSNN